MKKAYLLPVYLGIAALWACSGVNPATVPAPLVEIPSEFSVPKSVGVDVSQASSGTPSKSASVKIKAIVGGQGQFSEVIAFGPDLSIQVNDLLSQFLSLITQFEIPTSTTVKNFNGVPPGTEGHGVAIKFDFSDYDFNGDGKPDGFSGCTCPVGCAPELAVCPSEAPASDLKPVGFRIWQQQTPGQYVPIMAGFFDVLPIKDDPNTPQNEENPGKGSFRFARIDSTNFGSNDGQDTSVERILIAAIYDQRDPINALNQSAELFLVNDITTLSGDVPLFQGSHVTTAQVAKTDPAGVAYLEKTVKAVNHAQDTSQQDGPGEKTSFHAYTGRFRNDSDFWSGSFAQQETGTPSESFPTACARISTGDGVLQDVCLDLNIDTSHEDVTQGQTIAPATAADAELPADFPSTPNF